MSGEVSVVFTADDAALWQALQRTIAGSKKTEDGLTGISKGGAGATRELDRLAAATKRLVATPVQNFERHVAQLDAALAANKLTAEEHAAAVKLANKQLDAATRAANGTAAAEAAAAKEMERVAAAEAAATREMDQYVASVKKLSRKPVDDYDAAVAKLKATLAAGKITQKEYAAGMQDAAAKYAAARREIGPASTATQGFSVNTSSVISGARGLATVALLWKGVTVAIQAANAAAEKHRELAIESKDSQKTVATAQAETLQNLTGLSTAQKTDVLTKQLPALQTQTAFPDLAKLTQAVGAGFSASGDIGATMRAVKTAAEETVLMPDKLATVTAGLLDVARGTGITDTDAIQGFLLQAGAINRIEDPAKLASSLAPLVASGVARLPKQAAPEAAREIGALFGVLAGEGTDREGRSTETAANTLLGKMDTWFKSQNTAVAEAETKKKKGKPLDDADKAALAVGRVDTPATLRGQIEFFQNNAAARSDLLGAEGFGEQKFRTAIEQVLVAGSRVADKFTANIPQLSFDPATHRQVVSEQRTATPQLRLAMEVAKSNTASEQQKQGIGRGIEGFAFDDVQDALTKAAPRGMFDASLAAFEDMVGPWVASLAGTIDAAESINVQRNRLDMRIGAILKDQLSPAELQTVQREGKLTTARVDTLPVVQSIKEDLRRLTGAKDGLDLLIKSANANHQSASTGIPSAAAPTPAFNPLPSNPTPAQVDAVHADLFGPAAAATPSRKNIEPFIMTDAELDQAAQPTPAAASARQKLQQNLSVSPDTNTTAALDTAGRQLLAAAAALTAAAAKIPAGPPAGQIASVTRRPATGYPDYSSTARREQAVAAG